MRQPQKDCGSIMTKRYVEPIEGEKIILRLLQKEDLPQTLAWRNRPEIRKWFLNSEILSEEKHYAWFKRYRELDTDFIFIILAKELGAMPVGQVSLYNIDWDTSTAEFGRLMIGKPEGQGKGLAKEATQVILSTGFRVFKLNRIYLEVFQENEVAQKIYRDMGFREIGNVNKIIRMEKYPS